jgi:hypothetical protein
MDMIWKEIWLCCQDCIILIILNYNNFVGKDLKSIANISSHLQKDVYSGPLNIHFFECVAKGLKNIACFVQFYIDDYAH